MENRAHREPCKLPYTSLKHITNDFDKERILGSGGFGTVYKGVYGNSREIAVKVLHNISGLDDKEFHKEFDNLRGLKHPNVVELVGFCNESEKELVVFEGKQVTAERLRLALCFEYVQNGSLNKLISDEKTGFTWHTRYRIIKGICEGLRYLREGLEYPIMHFDLKPDNILLDESMVPKIADFGLSKLFGEENTKKTMSPVGTCGYWPPEYIKHQIISREFDIFSLGVIIVKIMTGHEGYNPTVEMTTRKAVRLVHESWKKKLRETLSHTSLEVYCNQVKRCIEIALECLNSNRQERPSIQDIVSSLDETERMIGDRGIHNAQFYHSKGRRIPTKYGPTTYVVPRFMSWRLVKEMTDNFSKARLLGQGWYGSVYKGINGAGQVLAVKKFSLLHGLADKEVDHEFEILRTVHHKNIVQLVGYSYWNEERVVRRDRKNVVSLEKYNALCFEYLQGGSLEQYILPDMSSGLEWQTQYIIIKGVCEGLRYLHEEMTSPIIHMDLKPSKILMDHQKMFPKIGGFGLARLVAMEKTFHRSNLSETFRYMPPEYITRSVITKGYDIFSLGVIILELMTGRETCRELQDMSSEKFIELEHEKWRERLQKTVNGTSVERHCQQVKKCLEIAVKCVEAERNKRPTIGDMIHMLNETEILIPQSVFCPETEQLLDVHPLELCFLTAMSTSSLEVPVRRKKAAMMSSSCCSLQLKNKGSDRVAFMLVANNPKRYLTKEPLCGVVPPRCAYTLTLTMPKQAPLLDSGDFFTLSCVTVGIYDLEKDSATIEYQKFFKKAEETAGDRDEVVQKVILKAIFDQPPQETSLCDPTRPAVEVIIAPGAQQVWSMDVHPTEPWIMTTHHVGNLRVWSYNTMAMMNSIHDVTDQPVHVAKFIARRKWLIAGDHSGCIHVYNYDENEDVVSFDAHDSCITTLAVHPSDPFVVSSSDDVDHLIKLWDWDKDWECTREFGGHTDNVTQVTFNPEDKDRFASASLDGTVKIWSICSDGPIITLPLDGENLLCVDYFARLHRQHLIVGCKDKSAQICDVGIRKGCVYELEGHADRITAVNLHPELPMLITGSLDGTVRIWNSTTYKLENIICFHLGAVYALGCIKGSRRIVVGCHQGIATMEISSL